MERQLLQELHEIFGNVLSQNLELALTEDRSIPDRVSSAKLALKDALHPVSQYLAANILANNGEGESTKANRHLLNAHEDFTKAIRYIDSQQRMYDKQLQAYDPLPPGSPVRGCPPYESDTYKPNPATFQFLTPDTRPVVREVLVRAQSATKDHGAETPDLPAAPKAKRIEFQQVLRISMYTIVGLGLLSYGFPLSPLLRGVILVVVMIANIINCYIHLAKPLKSEDGVNAKPFLICLFTAIISMTIMILGLVFRL